MSSELWSCPVVFVGGRIQSHETIKAVSVIIVKFNDPHTTHRSKDSFLAGSGALLSFIGSPHCTREGHKSALFQNQRSIDKVVGVESDDQVCKQITIN